MVAKRGRAILSLVLCLVCLLGWMVEPAPAAGPKKTAPSTRQSRDRWITVLKTGKPEQRAEAARELGYLRERRAVAPLLKALEDPDDEVRLFAARSLAFFKFSDNEEGVGALVDHLRDESEWVRRFAAHALMATRDERVIDALLNVMQENKADLPDFAAAGIVHPRNQNILQFLTQAKDGQNQQQQVFARNAIDFIRRVAQVRSPNSFLIQELTSKNALHRTFSALAFNAVYDERAERALVRRLKDQAPAVRRYAASALGFIGGKNSAGPVAELLSDSNGEVRQSAAFSLGFIGEKKISGKLVAGLSGGDSNLKAFSAGRPEALGPLMFLEQTEKEGEVGRRARWAIERLKKRAAGG
ncbi:MAG: HEAT repeat domain-containing protein [Candidatus Tectomicrobia bacterium]|uniref:HEAT repeat domain-containing protein n=1 Tax=Tectimicrobiota bacterium TaxID=2528274 RepID=A0A932GLZ0_UNCTE|nr:HEAT repeat domain-containing protein [Candidatus Tectomicrobia bacterium]